MFGLFNKKRRAVRRISSDLQETMEKAFDALRSTVDVLDENTKHHEMHARLTSLSLALSDVYPDFPQEKDSLFTRFVVTDLEGHPDCKFVRDAIEKHVRACPNIPKAKFEFMTYILAPAFMAEWSNERRSR